MLGKSDAYVLSPAEVNEAALYSVTPLLCAALSGNVKCVGVLLAAGARVDAAMYACVQREAPNAAILAVLSDAGVGDPPGTTCDHCGTPQTEQRLRACGSCFAALFCSQACLSAAWPEHRAECKRVQEHRKMMTRVVTTDPRRDVDC